MSINIWLMSWIVMYTIQTQFSIAGTYSKNSLPVDCLELEWIYLLESDVMN